MALIMNTKNIVLSFTIASIITGAALMPIAAMKRGPDDNSKNPEMGYPGKLKKLKRKEPTTEATTTVIQQNTTNNTAILTSSYNAQDPSRAQSHTLISSSSSSTTSGAYTPQTDADDDSCDQGQEQKNNASSSSSSTTTNTQPSYIQNDNNNSSSCSSNTSSKRKRQTDEDIARLTTTMKSLHVIRQQAPKDETDNHNSPSKKCKHEETSDEINSIETLMDEINVQAQGSSQTIDLQGYLNHTITIEELMHQASHATTIEIPQGFEIFAAFNVLCSLLEHTTEVTSLTIRCPHMSNYHFQKLLDLKTKNGNRISESLQELTLLDHCINNPSCISACKKLRYLNIKLAQETKSVTLYQLPLLQRLFIKASEELETVYSSNPSNIQINLSHLPSLTTVVFRNFIATSFSLNTHNISANKLFLLKSIVSQSLLAAISQSLGSTLTEVYIIQAQCAFYTKEQLKEFIDTQKLFPQAVMIRFLW
jgi:hypothetical protein